MAYANKASWESYQEGKKEGEKEGFFNGFTTALAVLLLIFAVCHAINSYSNARTTGVELRIERLDKKVERLSESLGRVKRLYNLNERFFYSYWDIYETEDLIVFSLTETPDVL